MMMTNIKHRVTACVYVLREKKVCMNPQELLQLEKYEVSKVLSLARHFSVSYILCHSYKNRQSDA